MKKKDELINLLYYYPTSYFSSKVLAEKLNISQKEVYSYIRKLRAEGYNIKGKTSKGYSFVRDNSISAKEIMQYFSIEKEKIRIFTSLPSTNTTAKEMASCGAPEGTICIADAQTHGRGRMGRQFFSPGGSGIYMSIILRPAFSPSESLLITTIAAVAVCDAIEEICACTPKIKWVNDVYISDKKVAGILTEAVFSNDNHKIEYAVLGIGLNLKAPEEGFPKQIHKIAGAVLNAEETCSRNKMIALILKHFYKYYLAFENKSFIKAYKNRDYLAGKEVIVTRGDSVYDALVKGINEDLSLKIEKANGLIENLSSGEVSIKLQN